MPGTTTNQGIIVPIGTDVANNPMAFVDMTSVVEPRLVQQYASRAARAADNPTPPTNTMSIITGETWYERYTGTKWLPTTPIRAVKTSDESVNNTTTVISDAELFVPIPPVVGWWEAEAWIVYSSNTTPDIKFQFAASAAFVANTRWSVMGLGTSAASAANAGAMNLDSLTNLNSPLAAGGVGADSVACKINVGFESTGTAGTLQLQWAQNVADASATTVFDTSWLRLTANS